MITPSQLQKTLTPRVFRDTAILLSSRSIDLIHGMKVDRPGDITQGLIDLLGPEDALRLGADMEAVARAPRTPTEIRTVMVRAAVELTDPLIAREVGGIVYVRIWSLLDAWPLLDEPAPSRTDCRELGIGPGVSFGTAVFREIGEIDAPPRIDPPTRLVDLLSAALLCMDAPSVVQVREGTVYARCWRIVERWPLPDVPTPTRTEASRAVRGLPRRSLHTPDGPRWFREIGLAPATPCANVPA